MHKKILVMLLVCVIAFMSSCVYAKNWPTPNEPIGQVKGTTGKVVQTISLVVKPLALGAIAIAGLRYMFASADKKADIKKDIIYIVIGSLFIFGTSVIVDFVVDAANELL